MPTNTLLGFVVGVVVGAVAALFLAPKSGVDLRADLVREAQARQERFRQEVDRANKEMSDRLDKIQSEVQTTLDQVQDQAKSSEDAA